MEQMEEDASMSLGTVLFGTESTPACNCILLKASSAKLLRENLEGFIVCTMNVTIGSNMTNPTMNHNDAEDRWEVGSSLRTSEVLVAIKGLLSPKSASLPLLKDNIVVLKHLVF